MFWIFFVVFFFFQAEDGIRDYKVTGVQTCALPISMLGVAASLGVTLLTVGVGVYLRRSYSTGLFLGVPFTVGYISSYIYNYGHDRPAGQSIVIALASTLIAGGALVLFAFEGTICTLMA